MIKEGHYSASNQLRSTSMAEEHFIKLAFSSRVVEFIDFPPILSDWIVRVSIPTKPIVAASLEALYAHSKRDLAAVIRESEAKHIKRM